MASRNKKSMGKGIEALFDIDENDKNFDIFKDFNEEYSEGDIKNIKIRDIEPNKKQPRKNFDKEKLEILSESIKNHGIVQPIRAKGAGERPKSRVLKKFHALLKILTTPK